MTGLLDQLYNLILWQIHIYDVIIGIGFSLLIPFIYIRIQRGFRKLRVIKFWNIFLKEVDRCKKELDRTAQIATVSYSDELICILSKLRRIELLVSDILDEEQFHAYLDRVDLLEQVARDTSGNVKDKIESVEEWLKELISTNKMPFYVMRTAPQSGSN